jgi:hypothetical protein
VKKSCVKIIVLLCIGARAAHTCSKPFRQHQTYTCLKHSILSTKRVCELPLLAMQRCWMAGSVWALDVSCALDSWVGQLDLISLRCDRGCFVCSRPHPHHPRGGWPSTAAPIDVDYASQGHAHKRVNALTRAWPTPEVEPRPCQRGGESQQLGRRQGNLRNYLREQNKKSSVRFQFPRNIH